MTDNYKFAAKLNKAEKKNEELTKLYDAQQSSLLHYESNNKRLETENQKLKYRIQKIMQRKGKMESGIKMCGRCQKEYNEKENYNWSCRIHSSPWGGEMYWCCGKTNVNAVGCRP
jgi:hypothetical protein